MNINSIELQKINRKGRDSWLRSLEKLFKY